MEEFADFIVKSFAGLAGKLAGDALVTSKAEELRQRLERDAKTREAIASGRSIREELFLACNRHAQNRHRAGVKGHEKRLLELLADSAFQEDLHAWVAQGWDEARQRLVAAMERVLEEEGATSDEKTFLKEHFFVTLERFLFADPMLAHWRQQNGIDSLRQRVDEAAGRFSPERERVALENYCKKSLAAWDIIDLSNMPEGDTHIATTKILLRKLYMPLRIQVEAVERVEEAREARRRREAGYSVGSEEKPQKSPVGERLRSVRRLVVLGDPGGGKTTLLRWMATAYLLRFMGEEGAFAGMPDIKILAGSEMDRGAHPLPRSGP
ncbi:MAG: hypothetical protein HQM03_00560 [Magnetococcales bacterium]|nr:hypothetical protein [Magnetococcales bacterium]